MTAGRLWVPAYFTECAGFLLTPALPTLPGDFDFDGDADGGDLLVWQQEVGAMTSSHADANDDGLVNEIDFAVWKAKFGQVPSSGHRPIPEPSSIVVCMVAHTLAGVSRCETPHRIWRSMP
jgi:hypothetical protein